MFINECSKLRGDVVGCKFLSSVTFYLMKESFSGIVSRSDSFRSVLTFMYKGSLTRRRQYTSAQSHLSRLAGSEPRTLQLQSPLRLSEVTAL